jgi:DNA (cytosine-5)-methyltransferase 1
VQKPIAMWNSARGVWEKTTGGGLLCEHLEPFSETWPTSGTMLDGVAYEQPRPVPPTTDTEYLYSPGGGVSVPTPTVSDAWTDGYERSITKDSPNRGVGLPTWASRIKLLRTVSASDGDKSGPNQRDSNGYPSLSKQLILLRTPTAAEVEGGATLPSKARAEGRTVRLAAQALDKANWGDFTPAIERWAEIIGRPAPEPTLADGQKGQHRLSSKFTEWLMGLPDGWITGHGLHRKDEIKMAGNGVVPQQARLALAILLDEGES